MAPSNRFYQLVCALMVILCLFTNIQPSFALSNTSEKTNVVLQLRWDHQFQFAGYYAAKWLGYYEEEGLSVEIRSAFKDGEILDVPTEIGEGRADFGVGAANILIAQDTGTEFSLVASIFQRSAVEYCTLLSNRGNTVYDLSQMNIARRPGDLMDLELQALFASEGISSTVHRTSDKTEDFTLEDLKNGSYDVVPQFLGQVSYTALKENTALKVIEPAEYGIDFYGDTLFTSLELASDDPELVERFRRASIKGWYYALENPTEMTDLIVKRLPRSSSSPNLESELRMFNNYQAGKVIELTHYPIVMVGNINTFRWYTMAEVMYQLEIIEAIPNLDRMIFNYDQIKMDQLRETRQNLYVTFVFVTLVITIFFPNLSETT